MTISSQRQPSTINITPKRRLKVLISAYACEPGKGSEPGCGWNYVLQAARHCDVTVITRKNNGPSIQEYELLHSTTGINWLFYDLPGWLLWLKQKLHLVNTYYYLWQWYSVIHAQRKLLDREFDLLHHLTFGSFSKPSFLFRFSKAPFLWGPIGGIINFNADFLRHASLHAKMGEIVRHILQKIVKFNPMIRSLRRKSALVLGVSNEVLAVLNCSEQAVLSQVGIDLSEFSEFKRMKSRPIDEYVVMMAGRLLHWKGFSLGIESFSRFVQEFSGNAKLIIIGEGPERSRLQALVSRLGIDSYVEFKGNVSRTSYFQHLENCDTFLFPSSHEPGSYVVAEALALGVPVICSTFGEPCTLLEHEVSGFSVDLGEYDQAVNTFCACLNKLSDPVLNAKMSAAAIEQAKSLSWEARGDLLHFHYINAADG